MIGSKVYERQFNPAAYALAALCAPALSAAIVLIGVLISGIADSTGRSLDIFGSVALIGLLLVVLFALWGVIPALVFGAVVMVPLERLRRGRNPPQWVYLVAGMGAAAIYVLVSLGLAPIIGAGVNLFAPWTAPLGNDAPVLSVTLVVGAIVLAGGLAGLIYERFSRVEYVQGKKWRPSDGPRSDQREN